jgi:hypothetical protein
MDAVTWITLSIKDRLRTLFRKNDLSYLVELGWSSAPKPAPQNLDAQDEVAKLRPITYVADMKWRKAYG